MTMVENCRCHIGGVEQKKRQQDLCICQQLIYMLSPKKPKKTKGIIPTQVITGHTRGRIVV